MSHRHFLWRLAAATIKVSTRMRGPLSPAQIVRGSSTPQSWHVSAIRESSLLHLPLLHAYIAVFRGHAKYTQIRECWGFVEHLCQVYLPNKAMKFVLIFSLMFMSVSGKFSKSVRVLLVSVRVLLVSVRVLLVSVCVLLWCNLVSVWLYWNFDCLSLRLCGYDQNTHKHIMRV